MLSFSALPLREPLRLDLYVHQLFPHVSRTQLSTVFRNRGILLGDHAAKKSEQIRGKEQLHILSTVSPLFLTHHLSANPKLPLSIIYEDDYLFVLDKAAGIATTPQHFLQTNTLGNAALCPWPFLETVSPNPLDLGFLQRLDQGTSGLVLGAKDRKTWLVLKHLMQTGKIEKIYIALVMGLVREDRSIHWKISSQSKHAERVRVETDKTGLHVTAWKILERKGDHTLLRISIRQGARHQIRAHLAALGHPVVGDLLYGGGSLPGLGRHFLHAHELSFLHPVTEERLVVQSPLPAELSTQLQHPLNRN